MGYCYFRRILEEIESLADILEAVLLAHLNDHDFKELLEIDTRRIKLLVALAQVSDQFDDVLGRRVEPQGSEYNL
jgi:hypothetical protein